ncbi:hypothetical protein A6A06_38705 [Streptomyces sp. CB02923]|nr:hypothetical protein A6A06_38705 [Streptomyces sp. CB02923]
MSAGCGHDDFVSHLSCDRRPDRVIGISRLVRMEYMQPRRAVDLLLSGVVLLSASAVVAVVTD